MHVCVCGQLEGIPGKEPATLSADTAGVFGLWTQIFCLIHTQPWCAASPLWNSHCTHSSITMPATLSCSYTYILHRLHVWYMPPISLFFFVRVCVFVLLYDYVDTSEFDRDVPVLQCVAPTTAWGGTSIYVFLPNLILNIYHTIHLGWNKLLAKCYCLWNM